MLDLLRDGLWQSVGALLALLAILASFWIYKLQQQRKELAFGVISTRRLLTVADELSTRVTVHLDGRQVRDLHLLVFGLKNSGTVAVRPEDFERPLRIVFDSGEIVSASVSSERPYGLGTSLTVSASTVELTPLLMNANDQVLVQILLSAPAPNYSASARVVDVPELVPVELRPRLPPLHRSGLLFLALPCALIAIYFLFSGDPDLNAAFYWIGVAVISLCSGVVARFIERIKPSSRRFISEA